MLHPPREGLVLMDAAAMGLDSEARLYDDTIAFENTILNVDRLRLCDSREIRLVNCIICGDLLIGEKSRKVESVFLYSCIVLGTLSLLHLDANARIEISCLNCRKLLVNQCRLAKAHITQCKIGMFAIYGSTARSLYAEENAFTFLDVADSHFNSVSFDHRQVNLDALCLRQDCWRQKRKIQSLNHFHFLRPHSFPIMSERNSYHATIDTLRFLRESTAVDGDKNALAKIKEYEAYYFQRNYLSQILVGFFGAFVRPRQILLLATLVYIACAWLYSSPLCMFYVRGGKTPTCIDITDALYFSGITITTIGYGDIWPYGLGKAIAVGEGAVGVILASCFVVALVRRYIEK